MFHIDKALNCKFIEEKAFCLCLITRNSQTLECMKSAWIKINKSYKTTVDEYLEKAEITSRYSVTSGNIEKGGSQKDVRNRKYSMWKF